MTDENTKRTFEFRLTRGNARLFAESVQKMRDDRVWVEMELKRCPLEVQFADHRFVFSGVAEFHDFLDQAQAALHAHDATHPPPAAYWPELGTRDDLVRALAKIVEAVDPTITWAGMSANQIADCIVTTLATRKNTEKD